jgi:hypothetical protein
MGLNYLQFTTGGSLSYNFPCRDKRIANYTSQNEAEYIFAEMHGVSLESPACMAWQSITASDWL